MIDKQQVKSHFSKNASNYNQYAHVRKKMKDILIKFILQNNKDFNEIKNILEIGCGTGYLTSTLAEIFPSAHITAVDIAPGMISEIKSKFTNTSMHERHSFVFFLPGETSSSHQRQLLAREIHSNR